MQKPKFAIFASGAGSTFEAIIKSYQEGHLEAIPVGLIVSSKTCGAIEKARSLQICHSVLDPKDFENYDIWDAKVLERLITWEVDFIICAGFLKLIGPKVLHQFNNKILNTHPSLLPKYGGKGMYGSKVHKAVAENNETQTGITVHLVTEEYDSGPIIRQKTIPLLGNESWQQIEEKVKAFEKDFYIETIKQFFRNYTK